MHREWIQKEDKTDTNSYLEIIILTSVIYSKENRDVVAIDITNLLIQTSINRKPREDKIITKTKGLLVDILVNMDQENMVPL